MTTVYIQRDENGHVKGVYGCPQEGYAEEAIDSSSAEIVAFLAPPPPDIRSEILNVSQQALSSGFLHVIMLDIMTRYIAGVQDLVDKAAKEATPPTTAPTITETDVTTVGGPYYLPAYVETKLYYDKLMALQALK